MRKRGGRVAEGDFLVASGEHGVRDHVFAFRTIGARRIVVYRLLK